MSGLPPGRYWTAAELAIDPVVAAPALLGTWLVRDLPDGQRLAGRIVETEAYAAEIDPACHAYKRETDRNRAMFGPAGNAYVYLIYGMHYCINVVTDAPGRGSAVLIRALAPTLGVDEMARRRGLPAGSKQLTNGPGKLCQAMGIDRALDHLPLTGPGEISLWRPDGLELPFETSPRIGISQAVDWLWRFTVPGDPWVSKAPKRLQ